MKQPIEPMTADEFMHHIYSVTNAVGWTWLGGDNVMVDKHGTRYDWPSGKAVECAQDLLPHPQRLAYSNALPLHRPWQTWTVNDRLRAFSVAVGRPWGGSK